MPQGAETVPAAPFVEWLQRLKVALKNDPALKLGRLGSGVEREIAQRLGVSTKAVYRYLRSINNEGRAVDVFDRACVEDMLDRAGIPFWHLYPELATDVELEPDVFCESCFEMVTPIGGLCPWCTPAPGDPRACPRCGGWKYNKDSQMCSSCSREVRYGRVAA